MARGPSAAPEGETKAQKFVRVAPSKVNKVLNDIASMNALASTEYTAEQLGKMREAIEVQIKKTFDYLTNPKGGTNDGFKF